jgi:hypothetical protein
LGQDAINLGCRVTHATVTGLIVQHNDTKEEVVSSSSSSNGNGNESKGEWNGVKDATPKGRIVGVTIDRNNEQIRAEYVTHNSTPCKLSHVLYLCMIHSIVVVALGAWTTKLLPQLTPIMHPCGQVVLWFKLPEKYIPLFQPPLFPPYGNSLYYY